MIMLESFLDPVRSLNMDSSSDLYYWACISFCEQVSNLSRKQWVTPITFMPLLSITGSQLGKKADDCFTQQPA